MQRRDFLITAGAAACGIPLLSVAARAASRTPMAAVLGAGLETEYGRGALMGMEEARRSAELLGSPLRLLTPAAPGVSGMGELVAELSRGGALAVVASPGTPAARTALEAAAVAEGLVVVDAAVAHPATAGREGVVRTGVPAPAYGMALLSVLVSERPEWGWGVIADNGASPETVARVRSLVPAGRLVAESRGEGRAGGGESADAWVHVATSGTPPGDDPGAAGSRSPGGTPLPPGVGAGTPLIRLDPGASGAHPPVAGLCATLWDSGLFRYGAEQLNARFRRRFGDGMTAPAWAGWMAVKVLSEAMLRAGAAGDPGREALLAGLRGRRAAFDGHKGVPLAFTGSTRSLAQPLYVTGGGRTREVEWTTGEGGPWG